MVVASTKRRWQRVQVMQEASFDLSTLPDMATTTICTDDDTVGILLVRIDHLLIRGFYMYANQQTNYIYVVPLIQYNTLACFFHRPDLQSIGRIILIERTDH